MTVTRLLPAIFFVLLATACASDPVPDPTLRPTSLTVSRGEVGRSTVALNPEGNQAWVAWVERTQETWDVWVRSVDSTTGVMGDPVRVNATPGNAAVHAQAPPQVGVDREGRVYVAWINRIDVPGRRFPANDLFVTVSEDGGQTFGPELPVNSDFGGEPAGHTFHNLTALPDGAMLVSWIDSRDRPPATTDGQMTDHAAMHQKAGSQIRVARIENAGAQITETAILDRTSCPCCRTFITVTDTGRILVAWRHEFESGERDVVMAHSDDGGRTFSDWRPIHRDHWLIEGCPHTGPVLGVDASGVVHALWYTGADGGDIRHATSTDGGLSFGEPTAVLKDIPVAQAAFLPGPEGSITLLTEDPVSGQLVSWNAGSMQEMNRVAGELPSAVQSGGHAAMTWRSGDEILFSWR